MKPSHAAALVVVLAGLLHALSIANPWDGQPAGWLQLLGLGTLAWMLARCGIPSRAALLGWLFATAWLAGTFWWMFVAMHTYAGLDAWLAGLAVLTLTGAAQHVLGGLRFCRPMATGRNGTRDLVHGLRLGCRWLRARRNAGQRRQIRWSLRRERVRGFDLLFGCRMFPAVAHCAACPPGQHGSCNCRNHGVVTWRLHAPCFIIAGSVAARQYRSGRKIPTWFRIHCVGTQSSWPLPQRRWSSPRRRPFPSCHNSCPRTTGGHCSGALQPGRRPR